MGRLAFNRRAVELDQLVFWRADAHGDGTLDPDELVVTWRHEPLGPDGARRRQERVTPKFRDIYEPMLQPDDTSINKDSPQWQRRLEP